MFKSTIAKASLLSLAVVMSAPAFAEKGQVNLTRYEESRDASTGEVKIGRRDPLDANYGVNTIEAGTEATQDAYFRNIDQYNLENKDFGIKEGVGMAGVDPVEYFALAVANTPASSSDKPVGISTADIDNLRDATNAAGIEAEYGGITYRFSTEENKETFLANPEKYEPAYGAWCAFAMVNGQKVSYKLEYAFVQGDRLYLFVDKGPQNDFWKRNASFAREKRADRQWQTTARNRGGEYARNANYADEI